MLNKDTFSKRIEELLNYYEISASALADKIGIQRSSISHILSGRNNPSLDFVLKILDNFPEITFDWLVKGKGEIYISEKIVEQKKDSTPTLFDLKENRTTIDSKEESKSPRTEYSNKKIEKIILLYADGSFKSYKP